MARLSLILILLLISLTSYADWKLNYYTDDSDYYHQVTTDGFVQFIRVGEYNCSELESIWVEFRENKNKVYFERTNSFPNNFYGINTSDYCWYKVTVHNLDLNNPKANQFVFAFKDHYGQTYYYSEVTDSILPYHRLKENIEEANWMTPGTQGANLVYGGGVLFKIWAPDADYVELHLDSGNEQYKMLSDYEEKNLLRQHILYSRTANQNTLYHFQFVIDGNYEVVEIDRSLNTTNRKMDPMARAITYQDKNALINNYQDVYSVVSERPDFYWEYDHYIKSYTSISHNNNWIIYQLWPMAFNPKLTYRGYQPGTFNGIIERIDYLSNLGITAVELLPVNEFRFKASWGYLLDSIKLIESSYGTRYDLMNLSDKLHQRGIKLVLDIVLNHINNNLIRDPLSPERSSSKFYDGDTGWGPIPRFASPMVKKWIADTLISLIRDYHIDGFRFDMIKYVYMDSPEGYRFLQELNLLLKIVHPTFHSMAEELPDNVWATYSTDNGGLGFDSQWSDIFKNFFEHDLNTYKRDQRAFDASKLIGALHGYSNHDNSPFGAPEKTVNFLGSHDFVGNRDPIIRIVSDYINFESAGNQTFYQVKPLEDKDNLIDNFRLIHNDFTHSFTRLAYGILFTKPGNILFFQGEEFASDINIENEWHYIAAENDIPTQELDLHRFVSSHKMLWEYLDPTSSSELYFLTEAEINLFQGHYRFFQEMINFRHNYPGIAHQNVYNLKTSYNGSIITYQIQSDHNEFFIILNFGFDLDSAWLSFPGNSSTYWKEIINSSTPTYGGISPKYVNIIDQLGGRSNSVRVKGPSIAIFKKVDNPEINQRIYFMSNFNDWTAHQNFELLPMSDGISYGVNVYIEESGIYEFKLATHNWNIELGSANEHTYYNLNYGQLSYCPDRPNVKVMLEKGVYSFIFDINNFGYRFTKL